VWRVSRDRDHIALAQAMNNSTFDPVPRVCPGEIDLGSII